MGPKVLIVDDEPPIANVVALKFRNAGLDILVAMDGEEAYASAKRERPDLIVTDLQMPGMNGLDLCRRLAEEGVGVPTILLTGKGFEVGQTDLSDLPIRRVMTKPFSPRELLAEALEALSLTVAT